MSNFHKILLGMTGVTYAGLLIIYKKFLDKLTEQEKV